MRMMGDMPCVKSPNTGSMVVPGGTVAPKILTGVAAGLATEPLKPG